MTRSFFDRESMELCRSLNGWWDSEFNECIVILSRLPEGEEFDVFRECHFCGGQDAELHVTFNSNPPSLDDVEVYCDKCIDKFLFKQWKKQDRIWEM